MLQDGQSIRATANTLGVTKAVVERVKKRLGL